MSDEFRRQDGWISINGDELRDISTGNRVDIPSALLGMCRMYVLCTPYVCQDKSTT